MLVIVDYGLGNLGSVGNMLRRIGVTSRISSSADDVKSASALVLPGVGAFDVGMRNLRARGLVEPLRERVLEQGCPILGICLGMQLLTRASEEGEEQGLGWIQATTKRFDLAGTSLPVPHMGWNDTRTTDATLFHDLPDDARFYFVHSYHVVCDDPADVAATCRYGGDVTAAIHHGNIYGTQFHPEKSHKFGMRVLQNFAKVAEAARC